MIDITERKRKEDRARVGFGREVSGVFSRDTGSGLHKQQGRDVQRLQPRVYRIFGYKDKEEFLALHMVKDTYKYPEDRKRFMDSRKGTATSRTSRSC